MFEQNFEQDKRFLRALPAGRISHLTSRIYPSLAGRGAFCCVLSRSHGSPANSFNTAKYQSASKQGDPSSHAEEAGEQAPLQSGVSGPGGALSKREEGGLKLNVYLI